MLYICSYECLKTVLIYLKDPVMDNSTKYRFFILKVIILLQQIIKLGIIWTHSKLCISKISVVQTTYYHNSTLFWRFWITVWEIAILYMHAIILQYGRQKMPSKVRMIGIHREVFPNGFEIGMNTFRGLLWKRSKGKVLLSTKLSNKNKKGMQFWCHRIFSSLKESLKSLIAWSESS